MADFPLQENGLDEDVLAYYASRVEDRRLQQGIGQLEFLRTQEILSRYLPSPPGVIYDVGGGTGVYSCWLARKGYEVHLLELSPEHVAKASTASENQPEHPLTSIEVADARELDRPDRSADVLLLMGPLYHLIKREDRLRALKEASRVLNPNGLLFAAGITRFGNALWGLSTYGSPNWYLDEDEFMGMVMGELNEGQHFRPDKYPDFIPRSYFHLPGDLRGEIEEAGFAFKRILAVEGPGWIVPNFDNIWSDDARREKILEIVRVVEEEPSIMGMSPHFMVIARKPG